MSDGNPGNADAFVPVSAVALLRTAETIAWPHTHLNPGNIAENGFEFWQSS